MNKHIEGLPFYLLVSFSVLFFFQTPNVAGSIIVIALAALCGYRYYQEANKQPNYKEDFKQELASLEKRYTELKHEYGKLAMEKTNLGSKKSSGFSF